jgi:hypothetical protein
MPVIEGVPFCDGCGAEIHGPPVVVEKRLHCCELCAEGLDCDCALILEDDRRDEEPST